MKYEIAPEFFVTVKKTTPKNVKAYREALAAYLDDPKNAEKDVMEATFHVLPFACDPVTGSFESLEYDDFYAKEAEKAVADFLPRGMETLRMLSGF